MSSFNFLTPEQIRQQYIAQISSHASNTGRTISRLSNKYPTIQFLSDFFSRVIQDRKLSPELKSMVMTGAILAEKNNVAEEYGKYLSFLPRWNPANHPIYRNAHTMIGVTIDNLLDEVSEKNAIDQFNHYQYLEKHYKQIKNTLPPYGYNPNNLSKAYLNKEAMEAKLVEVKNQGNYKSTDMQLHEELRKHPLTLKPTQTVEKQQPLEIHRLVDIAKRRKKIAEEQEQRQKALETQHDDRVSAIKKSPERWLSERVLPEMLRNHTNRLFQKNLTPRLDQQVLLVEEKKPKRRKHRM